MYSHITKYDSKRMWLFLWLQNTKRAGTVAVGIECNERQTDDQRINILPKTIYINFCNTCMAT